MDKQPNRFVVFLFGDLKNYKFYYRYAILEMDTTKVNQTYANLVGTLIKEPNLSTLATAVGQYICKDQDDNLVESQGFKVNADFSLQSDQSTPLAEGGYLCFLDPSPKLPSQLVANYMIAHFAKTGQTKLNVVLVREKLSKLSDSVQFK